MNSAGDQLVKLGEDGQLPELALTEGVAPRRADQVEKPKAQGLIYLAVGFSFLLSIVMLLIDFDGGTDAAAAKTRARATIVEKFIGREGEPLRPYQRHLREAQRAHSRGDFREERQDYREVLEMLNSEDVLQSFNGLTGDLRADKELRDLISTLIGS